jgi:hypothetical protein
MGQTATPDTTGGVAVFELERFGWVAPDRIELSGCWYGLRARRFVRPTLFLNGPDGERRRLLALLDHKPWAAEDGETWIAAFAWDGEPRAFEDAELAVATGIDMELPAPETDTTPRKRRPRRFPYRAVSRGTVPAPTGLADLDGIVTEKPAVEPDAHDPDAPKSPSVEVPTELDNLKTRLGAVEETARREAALATELLEERDKVAAEQAEAAESTRRTLELELQRAREAHQQALREARERERSAASDSAASTASLRKDFETQLSALRSERDAMERERDKVQRRHDKVVEDRDKLAAERARLDAELAAAEQERDKALTRVGPRATWEPEKNALEIWTPRLIGVGLLLLFLVTVLLLFS